MRQAFIFSLILIAAAVSGADKVVFKETFDSPDALRKYRVVRQKNGAEFSVAGNALLIRHKHVPQSGFIEIPVPMIKKGRLDFDVTVKTEGTSISDGIGLTLDLYNISTFWHDACGDWRMYFPEPNSKRMQLIEMVLVKT